MDNKTTKILIIAFIILLLLLTGASWFVGNQMGYKDAESKVKGKIDTATKIITTTHTDTIFDTKWKTRVKTEFIASLDSVDTTKIIESHPYRASVDSIYNGDTVNISFYHPSRLLSLGIRFKLDSIIRIHTIDSIKISKPVIVEVPVPRTTWETVKEHSPTAAVAYILGGITVLILKR